MAVGKRPQHPESGHRRRVGAAGSWGERRRVVGSSYARHQGNRAGWQLGKWSEEM